jgi:hypothetical protein
MLVVFLDFGSYQETKSVYSHRPHDEIKISFTVFGAQLLGIFSIYALATA